MSYSEDNFGVQGSQPHTPIEAQEHAVIDEVHAKKVFPITLQPLAQTNPSFVLTYTGSNLTGVAMTIGSTTYNKTLSYDGSDNLTGVTVWTEA